MRDTFSVRAFLFVGAVLGVTIAGGLQPARADIYCGLLAGALSVPLYDKPNGAKTGSVDVLPAWTGKPVGDSAADDGQNWYEVSDGTKVLGFMKSGEGGVGCSGAF